MNETKVKQVAMNLTVIEFQGFCEGMKLTWFFRAVPSASNRTVKYQKFWAGAYDKYSQHCKG